MHQDEFDLFMAQALTAVSDIVHLQSIPADAMSKAGVVGDLYNNRPDEAGILKMAIAGTDDAYAAADIELNAIYTEIDKAGVTPALLDINDF